MSQLREFAQHKAEFDRRNISLLAISSDDVFRNRGVWKKVVNHQFPVLSDREARAICKYGLLHAGGDDGKSEDIAIRTILLVDEQGREVCRRVSKTAYDIASVPEVLEWLDGRGK